MKHHNIVMIVTLIISIAILIALFGESFLASKKKILGKSTAMEYILDDRRENDDGVLYAYSLWLLPPRELAKRLKTEIIRLGTEFNGTFHEPHVTLYGAIYTTNFKSVMEIARNLAKNIGPLFLSYDNITHSIYSTKRRWRGVYDINS